MAQMRVSLGLSVSELRALFSVSSEYFNWNCLYPCDDTLHKLESIDASQKILCFNNS